MDDVNSLSIRSFVCLLATNNIKYNIKLFAKDFSCSWVTNYSSLDCFGKVFVVDGITVMFLQGV